jgi:ketosteroid isomerase-like protein
VAAISPTETLTIWLAAINRHDARALAALMAEEHVFVDSLANRVQGATSMEAGWRAYFTMCPDYWVRADHVMAEGNTILAAGEAGGTIDGESWRIPAAWKAVIRDGRIVEWHVFADNKPVYEILAKRRR